MADRTLCDTTNRSQRLALLSDVAYGLYPYIFQETDDYGRLDTNSYLIKQQRFPLIEWVSVEIIEQSIQEYSSPEVAMLFLWEQDGYRYGYFVNFEARSGKFLSRRRKSYIPEPPAQKLSSFLKNRDNLLKDNNHFKTLQSLQKASYKLSQVKSSQVKKDGDKSPQIIKQFLTDFGYKSEKEIIEPLWNFYKQYFPNCKKCNYGVFVKIIRGADYPFTPENKIREAIEGTHQDNLYKKLEDPWTRFLDRLCQPSKYGK